MKGSLAKLSLFSFEEWQKEAVDFLEFKYDGNHAPLREGNPHPAPRCVRLPSLRKSALLALGKRLSGRVVAAGVGRPAACRG